MNNDTYKENIYVSSSSLGCRHCKGRDAETENLCVNHLAAGAEAVCNSDCLYHSKKRKRKRIFSFLQKFRTKSNGGSGGGSGSSNNNFDGRPSLPPSPRPTHHSISVNGYRWESVESALSSATATSFAFIPSSQLRHLRNSRAELSMPAAPLPLPVTNIGASCKTTFLRQKYNLKGSELSLNERDFTVPRTTTSRENPYRNSIGSVISSANWREQNFHRVEGGIRSPNIAATAAAADAAAVHYNSRKRCHKPGKKRAPSPPKTSDPLLVTINDDAEAQNRQPSRSNRKKRKAPSPPRRKMAEEETTTIMCNDTLKLEKGVLKANKQNTTEKQQQPATAMTSEAASTSSVNGGSPRPWYKRSNSAKENTTRKTSANGGKTLEKRKTNKRLLDELLQKIEASRVSSSSSSHHHHHLPSDKLCPRTSRLPILATISQLDREAAEIVKKGQKKELEALSSSNEKYYSSAFRANEEGSSENGVSATTTSSKLITENDAAIKKNKELLSILNAVTNIKRELQPSRAVAREEKKINELLVASRHSSPKYVRSPSHHTLKPSKPFCSWVCPRCTLENPSWKFICELCNQWRPYSINSIKTPKVIPKEDFKLKTTSTKDQPKDTLQIDGEKKVQNLSFPTNKVELNYVYVENETFTKVAGSSNPHEPNINSHCKIPALRKAYSEETPNKKLEMQSSVDNTSSSKLGEAGANLTFAAKNVQLNDLNKAARSEQNGKQEIEEKENFHEKDFNVLPINKKVEMQNGDNFVKSMSNAAIVSAVTVTVPIPQSSQQMEQGEDNVDDDKGKLNGAIQPELAKRLIHEMSLHKNDGSQQKKDDEKTTKAITVNRLLKKLQITIANGQHLEAANIAKELARLKVNCNMTQIDASQFQNAEQFAASNSVVLLEQASTSKLVNEEAVPVPVPEEEKVKPEVEKDLQVTEILTENEHNLQTDAKTSSSKGKAEISNTIWECASCTFINASSILNCAVCNTCRTNKDTPPPIEPKANAFLHTSMQEVVPERTSYQELINLEKSDVIENVEQFECPVCLIECPKGKGVVLRDCLHMFCRECLDQVVQFNTEAEVKCPFRDETYTCASVLQEREIKALVNPIIYEKHLARSLSEAQNKLQNVFRCKTTDCVGWCIYEDNVNEFPCPVCKKVNCLTCHAIHTGLNCKQYQDVLNSESETNVDFLKTKNMLMELVDRGEAMYCPTCQIILMKKWGCDWLKCSMCKTEICWITRGPRWGPAGKGDTTGGCRCGVKGIKCHPKCNYCH